MSQEQTDDKWQRVPVLIMWATLFIMQCFLVTIVILIAKSGASNLQEINTSFDPNYAYSFIVGPRDLLYGEFLSDSDSSDLSIVTDIARIGLFSNICDTVNDPNGKIFSTSYVSSEYDIDTKQDIAFTYHLTHPGTNTKNFYKESRDFCAGRRALVKCSFFDTEKITFTQKPVDKSIRSLIEVKKYLNETRMPLLLRLPAINRVNYPNPNCSDAGIETPASDPYGIIQDTSQYIALTSTNKQTTAIVVGWNDDIRVAQVGGTSLSGGLIVRIVDDISPRHSLDWWIGNVSVDVETQRCPNLRSINNWGCFNPLFPAQQPISQMVISEKAIEDEFLSAVECANLTVSCYSPYTTNTTNTTVYDFLIDQINQGLNSTFFAVCKEDNLEWGEFNITQSNYNYFDIVLMDQHENKYTFYHVWKEFLEEVFNTTSKLGQDTVLANRTECGYSFIPYDVVLNYMQAKTNTCTFHQFELSNIDCSGDGNSNIDNALPVDVGFEFTNRNFSMLENNRVYYGFDYVEPFEQTATKPEL